MRSTHFGGYTLKRQSVELCHKITSADKLTLILHAGIDRGLHKTLT